MNLQDRGQQKNVRSVTQSVARSLSIILLVFLSAGSLFGGIKLISDPHGNPWGFMPQSLLQHSPFDSYFIPGIVLLTANGVLPLWVLWLLGGRKQFYGLWVVLQGFILLGWLIVECVMVRVVNWAHYMYGAVALALILSGFALRHSKKSLASS